jgi:hypothetical protein
LEPVPREGKLLLEHDPETCRLPGKIMRQDDGLRRMTAST